MKRILLIATVALLAASCGPKGNTYVLKGTVTDSLALTPGAFIQITNMQTGAKDTAAIEGGKFVITGEASPEQMCFARLVIPDGPAIRGKLSANFIPEKGRIKLDLDLSTVSGTPLNNSLQAFSNVQADYMKEVMALYEQAESADEAAEAEIEAQIDEANAKFQQAAVACAKENATSIVGLTALRAVIYDISLEDLDSVLEGASDLLKTDSRITRIRDLKVAESQTAEGCMFKDFAGADPSGKLSRFSDYVGKGKYVLVDFWASWCGPCKGEIPNIKEMYETYGPKGLTVLGVAVWDKDNSGSRKTMEEYGMKWNQIFVGEDTTPTDIYGIAGIPRIMLFAPDGTIYKQSIRGAEIKKAVSEIYD